MKVKVNQVNPVSRHVHIYILYPTISQLSQPMFPTHIYLKFQAFFDYDNKIQPSQPHFATCTYLDFEAKPNKSTMSTNFSDTHICTYIHT